MTTKAQMIEIIKAENPTLQIGDDQRGYTQLSASDYEAQILEWSNARLDKQKQQLAEADAAATKAAKRQAIADKLGLTADEAAALFG